MAKLEPHTVNCAQCGTAFEALRAEAKYCSTLCRVNAHTARHKPASVKPTINSSEALEKLRRENAALRAKLEKQTAAASVKPTINSSEALKKKPSTKPEEETFTEAQVNKMLWQVFTDRSITIDDLVSVMRQNSVFELNPKYVEKTLRAWEKLPEPVYDLFHHAVRKQVKVRLAERFPVETEKLRQATEEADARAEELAARSKALDEWMTEIEFKKVLGCLASDRQPEDMRKRFDEATVIFRRLEQRLSRNKAARKRNGW